jgi:CubicO group peptidase (beta-lactamase class C family)
MTPHRDITLNNWLEWPFNRRSFQQVRELVPTAPIHRDRDREPRKLPPDPVHLDDVTFAAADGSAIRWADHLNATECDAVCILHRGRLVYERYLNGMTPRTPHLLMSVSKSFCGALLGIQVGKRLVSPDDLVVEVAPEWRETSLEGATIRHLIDMTAGTYCPEDYDVYTRPTEDHPLLRYERAAGYRWNLSTTPPIGILGHFRTLANDKDHGAGFEYRSVLTNIVARVIEEITDRPYPVVLGEELWSRLGPEEDAEIMLDPLGFPTTEGGMNCTVRDLARFGQAYLDGGLVEGDQVVPANWIDDTFDGDDRALTDYAASGAADQPDTNDWVMYRNAFWCRRRGRAISGIGIFGQFCFVDRDRDLVVARFSTFPSASLPERWQECVRGFEAIGEALA